jgi:peptidyl-prolyl cis-trans isomerase-like 2
MQTSDIIRLNMAKNADGLWHCPVLFKVFNSNSHIVAIRTTGNVYSYEAVHELNIKANNYTDLLSGEDFCRSDIITLQNNDDPQQVQLRDVRSFKYLQTLREDAAADKSTERSVRHNPTSERVMKEFERQSALQDPASKKHLLTSTVRDRPEDNVDVADLLALRPTTEDVNPGHEMSDQRASSSLTSSSVNVHTKSAIRLALPEEIRSARWKKMKEVRMKYLSIYLLTLLVIVFLSSQKKVMSNFRPLLAI